MSQHRSERRRSLIPRRSPSVSTLPLPPPPLDRANSGTSSSSSRPLSPESGGQRANGGSRIPISLASVNLSKTLSDGEPPLPPFTQPPSVADSWPPGSSLSISRNSSGRVISELQSQLSEVRREADALRAELKVVQKRNTVLVTERDEARERGKLENQGLARTLERRERLLAETTARTQELETETSRIKSNHADETQRIATLESSLASSTAAASQSQQEYLILSQSMDALKLRWVSEMNTVKAQMEDAVKGMKEGVELRERLETIERERKGAGEELARVVEEMRRDLEGHGRIDDGLERSAEELKAEMVRLRKLLITSLRNDPDQINDSPIAVSIA